MKTTAGLWIDHRKAVIAIVSAEGEQTIEIQSNVEKQPGRFAGVRSTNRSASWVVSGNPSKIAPAAPGKPTRERVCPAKVCRRSTMNHPMAPETTATIVPARSALIMNG